MIKAYSLQAYEMEQAAAIQREGMNASTAYGNLAIQMKDAEARLEGVAAKQRCLIEVVAKRCAIPANYNSARIEATNLVVDLPDEPREIQPVAPQPPDAAQKTNGMDLSAAQ